MELQDMEFGMYYGGIKNDTVAVFSVVLSDARCYQDKLEDPYMDSDGDMLVLQFRTGVLADDQEVRLPYGEYVMSDSGLQQTIYTPESYVMRMTGSTQVRWAIKSGAINLADAGNGLYNLTTKELILEKGQILDTVEYTMSSAIKVRDYSTLAPSLIGESDDIIDLPFPYMSCAYYGNLYGNGTGNFVVAMATKGFIEVDSEGTETMTNNPGVYITLNFFSKYYAANSEPFIEPGRYRVSALSADELYQRGTLMPGVLMDNTPFGSYLLQQTASGEGIMEYITGGYVIVEYPDDETCSMVYELNTSSRKISGTWTGVMPILNLAEASSDSFLTTLDHDVECDMSKVTSGSLRLIETLHRSNVEIKWDYDIAEAWQLYLQPRDWTKEEKDIPWVDSENRNGADGIEGTEDDWMYDKNQNGIRDRLEAWCGDGDVMVLEFILPLGSQGVIAPELNKTYTYTMQPSLEIDHQNYEIYVSRMGRPADEIFDPMYASQYPGWAEPLGITSYDRCNARRGFTWSTDGYRGNWYLHYETGRHMVGDGHAPAINGTVKVTRTADDIYDFEWEFIDDYPGTPNKITGAIKDCKVSIQLN